MDIICMYTISVRFYLSLMLLLLYVYVEYRILHGI